MVFEPLLQEGGHGAANMLMLLSYGARFYPGGDARKYLGDQRGALNQPGLLIFLKRQKVLHYDTF